MDFNQLRNSVNALNELCWDIENTLSENGGEYTEDVDRMECARTQLETLLSNEGADYLGRWLVQKEAERQMFKNEKATADAHLKFCEKTIDFIKSETCKLMKALGKVKIKGEFYSFVPSLSVTTKADTAAIKEMYYDRAVKALRDAGIPEYITVTLGGSITKLEDGEPIPEVFVKTEKETCKFGKPRANKE